MIYPGVAELGNDRRILNVSETLTLSEITSECEYLAWIHTSAMPLLL